MNILVTGGAGYLWFNHGWLSVKRRPQGQVVDNFVFGQASINQFCHHKNFDVVNGDVRIEKTMKPLIANADVIIPLAALVGALYVIRILWLQSPQIMTLCF